MLETALRWCACLWPPRTILCDGKPYLIRHYVCGNAPLAYWPEGTRSRLGWLPFAVYLHVFVRPDQDRDLHNHPWKTAVSLVLFGGYDEERFCGDRVSVRNLRPGRINVLRRQEYHRIVRLHGDSTWTLFFAGRYDGQWGFKDRDTGKHTGWRRYLRTRNRRRQSAAPKA